MKWKTKKLWFRNKNPKGERSAEVSREKLEAGLPWHAKENKLIQLAYEHPFKIRETNEKENKFTLIWNEISYSVNKKQFFSTKLDTRQSELKHLNYKRVFVFTLERLSTPFQIEATVSSFKVITRLQYCYRVSKCSISQCDIYFLFLNIIISYLSFDTISKPINDD